MTELPELTGLSYVVLTAPTGGRRWWQWTGVSTDDLNKQVTSWMNAGWEPIGGVASTRDSFGGSVLLQAMVRKVR